MDACDACGIIAEDDADGFIKLRRPAGIPEAAMGAIVMRLYVQLMFEVEQLPPVLSVVPEVRA